MSETPVPHDLPSPNSSVFNYPALRGDFENQGQAIDWVYSLGEGCPHYTVRRNGNLWEAIQSWLAVY